MLVRTQFPKEQLQQIDDLYEVKTMLAEQMHRWTQTWKQQGIEQGIEQGIQRVLKTQLRQRFGDLPEHVEQKIDAADQAQLERWLLQVLDAPSLTALFADS